MKDLIIKELKKGVDLKDILVEIEKKRLTHLRFIKELGAFASLVGYFSISFILIHAQIVPQTLGLIGACVLCGATVILLNLMRVPPLKIEEDIIKKLDAEGLKLIQNNFQGNSLVKEYELSPEDFITKHFGFCSEKALKVVEKNYKEKKGPYLLELVRNESLEYKELSRSMPLRGKV